MAENKKTGGLAGVTAGDTQLCTVGKEGAGLTYRGYAIYDLANNARFEEVAYLLLIIKALPQPVSASTRSGKSVTDAMRRMSSQTSFSVVIARSGKPNDAFATTDPHVTEYLYDRSIWETTLR